MKMIAFDGSAVNLTERAQSRVVANAIYARLATHPEFEDPETGNWVHAQIIEALEALGSAKGTVSTRDDRPPMTLGQA